MSSLVKLVNLGSALEADMLVERLHAAGIDGFVRGNDIVGIFGPGFQGVTARGVDVLVPDDELERAREVLADFQEPLEEDESH
ncbi:MAG TPA: DUF2007 domain-containing protein [Gemmatimonadaceae bacterium]|nr:DUF2007 domain-containing protein [Gemmatimonadaceae bacterium]